MCFLRAKPIEIKWHSGLPIFASEGLLKAASNDYGWIGGTEDSGRLCCFLPYIIIRKSGFRFARFRTEIISLNRELDPGEERSFLNSVVGYFRSIKADMIIPAFNTAILQAYPEGAIVAPYGTFIKQLNQPEEVLFREIYSDYRNKIRKATKSGVQIKNGMEHLRTVYNLIADTLRRSDVRFRNYDDFRRSILSFGEHIRVFVAEHDGVVQAGMVAPFSDFGAYDWYSGTIPKPSTGAMHLLIWEAMRHFREIGVRQFDFTGVRINPEKGTKQEGISNFKMRFGGRLVRGYMWKYPIRPIKYGVYSVAVRLLMGGDIVDKEHHKLVGEQRLL
jgi:hypothetical protein